MNLLPGVPSYRFLFVVLFLQKAITAGNVKCQHCSNNSLGIVHMSDIHGAYLGGLPNNTAIYGSPAFGGPFTKCMTPMLNTGIFSNELYPFLEEISLFAGDLFYGSFLDVTAEDSAVEAIRVAQAAQFDVLTVGDSDFKYGVGFLIRVMEGLYPQGKFVCTNLDYSMLESSVKQKMQRLCPRHQIVNWTGKRIGFLGYLLPYAHLTSKIGNIRIREEIMALTEEVKVLRKQGIKIFIALGHSGFKRNIHIAESVPSLDVIVSGHSHVWGWSSEYSDNTGGSPELDSNQVPPAYEYEPYPAIVLQRSGRKVLVLASGHFSMFVGLIYVDFDDEDEVVGWNPFLKLWPKQPISAEDIDQYYFNPAGNLSSTWYGMAGAYCNKFNMTAQLGYMANMTNGSHAQFLQRKAAGIANTVVYLNTKDKICEKSECNLGNLLTDSYVWYIRKTTHDYAIPLPTTCFVDAAHVGKSKDMQQISWLDIEELVTDIGFVNAVLLSGKTVLDVFEHAVADGFSPRFLQVSGAFVRYNMANPPGQRVVEVKVMCSHCARLFYDPLEPQRDYLIAMPESLTRGAHGYDMIVRERKQLVEYGVLNAQALYAFIQQRDVVYHAMLETRIVVENEKAEWKATKPGGNTTAKGLGSVPSFPPPSTVLVVIFVTFGF